MELWALTQIMRAERTKSPKCSLSRIFSFCFLFFLSADIITPSNLLLMMSVLMDGANELISNYSVGVIFTNNSCHISNNSNVAR